MMELLMWLLRWANGGARSHGDVAYQRAMTATNEVLQYMRSASNSNDPARAVMADIWHQRHNVPFMTATMETVEEMKSPLQQSPLDK
jgi:hypothetical protein